MTVTSIEKLEKLFNMILVKLKNDGLNEIEIANDEYWIILTNQWSDFSKDPEIAVGSIQEDINFLNKALEANEILTYADLDRVASILRMISELQAPSY